SRPRGARWTPAIIGIDLDPIRSTPDLAANDLHHLLDARRLFSPLRRVEGVVGSPGTVAARRDNGARRGDDAWPRHEASVDRPAQLYVIILRPFGTQIARGRDAGEDCGSCMGYRSGHAKAQRLFQHLVI